MLTQSWSLAWADLAKMLSLKRAHCNFIRKPGFFFEYIETSKLTANFSNFLCPILPSNKSGPRNGKDMYNYKKSFYESNTMNRGRFTNEILNNFLWVCDCLVCINS